MANVKEKVEAKQAVSAVVEADKKVEQIKLEKAAAKAKKHEERLQKHPKLGKVINWLDDNKVGIGVGVAIGGPIGVAATIGAQKAYSAYQAKKAGVETVTDADDSETDDDTSTFD